MKKDRIIAAIAHRAPLLVLGAGIILLCIGVGGNPDDRIYSIPGAILLGSWHIARQLSTAILKDRVLALIANFRGMERLLSPFSSRFAG